MKKSTAKRLTLHRETLAYLQNERMETVRGGLSVKPGCSTASGCCPPPPTGNNADTCLC
jgi:hypothetical protein